VFIPIEMDHKRYKDARILISKSLLWIHTLYYVVSYWKYRFANMHPLPVSYLPAAQQNAFSGTTRHL